MASHAPIGSERHGAAGVDVKVIGIANREIPQPGRIEFSSTGLPSTCKSRKVVMFII
jgi:hypothetical protein